MPTDLTGVGIRDREYYKFRNHPDADKARVAVRIEDDAGNIVTFAENPATTRNSYNVTAVTAGTEYSQALPAGTKQYRIRARKNCFLRVASTASGTSTVYEELGPGSTLEDSGLELTGFTLYFRSNVSNTIVEIVAWT